MKRHVTMTAVAAALTIAFAAPVQAQGVTFFLGGGATVPIGDFKDFAKTGWIGNAGVSYHLPNNVFVFGEFFYGENKHDTAGEKTNPYGGMANVGYRFGDAMKPGLYIYGGVGALVHKFSAGSTSASDTQFAYDGAAGVDIPLGGVSLWIEARFLGTKDTQMIPIMAGVSIGG